MYQSEIGRFFAQDRFAEKYYSMNPYQYGLNNPMRYVDMNGDSVVAKQAEAQAVIASTIKEKNRGKLKFDENGNLDPKSVKGTLFSGNARALKRLAKDDEKYEVSVSEKAEYKDGDGNTQTMEMGQWQDDENGMPTFSGVKGITLLPGNDPEVPNSTNDNVQVIVNEKLDYTGQAQTLGHEGYGHAYMHAKGKPDQHVPGAYTPEKGWVDTNRPLTKQIDKRKRESAKNSQP
jgi:hypothetical protein